MAKDDSGSAQWQNDGWVADGGKGIDSTRNVFKNLLEGFAELGKPKGEGA